jgi:hypothetical protein
MELNVQRSFFPSSLRAIFRLFFSRRPFAIGFAISLVVVLAIKRKPLWAFSHIGDKVIKTLQPTPAHSNASPSIPFVKLARGIQASLFHSVPNMIGARPSRNAFTVCRVGFNEPFPRFSETATATSDMPASQILTANRRGFSALADTVPLQNSSSQVLSGANYKKSAKHLSRKIDSALGISESPIIHIIDYSTFGLVWRLM